MEFKRPDLAGLAKSLGRMKQQFFAKKPLKPDRREYTLMIVPHHGQMVKSIRIPIKLVKCSAIALGAGIIALTGMFIHYRITVNSAASDRVELARLRQVNGTQIVQIENLAKATASLQEDMNRLNKLDAEIRRIVNSEDLPGVSRSSPVRINSAGSDSRGGPAVKPQLTELANLVEELRLNAKTREQSLLGLREALVERNARLAATPSIWPAGGDVTSRYGWRRSPWGWGTSDWHPGIDIANDYGTPIVATASGTVIFSGWYGGYGKMLQIDHGNGIVTVYAHNSQNLVEVGQYVEKGELIAYMGSTGNSTGSHVHYEVRVNGTAVNPANFL